MEVDSLTQLVPLALVPMTLLTRMMRQEFMELLKVQTKEYVNAKESTVYYLAGCIFLLINSLRHPFLTKKNFALILRAQDCVFQIFECF